MNLNSKNIQIGKNSVSYQRYGAGEVVVLLHGYLESKAIWEQFLPLLTDNFDVITIDLPGHGESDNQIDQRVETMARAVKSVLDVENCGKIHLLGHSMGGYVALAFLEEYTEYLQSVTLLHSHPFADGDAAQQKRNREIEFVRAGKKELLASANIPNAFANKNTDRLRTEIELAKKIACKTSEEGIIACLQAMLERPDRSAIWSSSSISNLLVWGKEDNYISEEVVNKIPLSQTGRRVDIPGVGHQSFIENPEHTAKILKQFWTAQA